MLGLEREEEEEESGHKKGLPGLFLSLGKSGLAVAVDQRRVVAVVDELHE